MLINDKELNLIVNNNLKLFEDIIKLYNIKTLQDFNVFLNNIYYNNIKNFQIQK